MTETEIQEIQNPTLPEVLQIWEQKPFGITSSSEKWFEYTFIGREEKPLSKKAVVILAHPDDAEDIVGGTIGKLTEQGCDITLVVLTDGRWGIDHNNPMTPSELIRTRLEETLLGAQELGISKVINIGIEDREVPEDPKTDKELLGNLVDILIANPASLYITHASAENNLTKDYHSDHRNTAKLALEAIQRSRNGNGDLNTQPVLLYADTQGARNAHGIVKKGRVMHPKSSAVDVLLDITGTSEKKERAFAHHKTQIANIPDDIAHNYIVQARAVTRFRADQAKRKWMGLMRPTLAEGLSIHTGQGFSTDITRVFARGDMYFPKKGFLRRAAPTFG